MKKNIFRCLSIVLCFTLLISTFTVISVSAEGESEIWLLKDETILNEGETISVDTILSNQGEYAIKLDYKVLAGNVELNILIDGKNPIADGNIDLFALWKNDSSEFKQDNQGNDIRPLQVRLDEYYTVYLYDRSNGMDKQLILSLEAGVHTFEITTVKGKLSVKNMSLVNSPETVEYDDYISKYGEFKTNGYYDKVQAEYASLKSDASMYPGSDRNSPDVEPNNPSVQKLNIIGGYTYADQGEFLEWDIEVPQDGLYTISFKYRQNINRGVDSHRRILIDGILPFNELDCISFPYGSDWELKTVGDDTPFSIYLTKGTHKLTLEVVPGEIGEALNELEKIVLRMNDNYRSIIMVTSTEPDTLRDYNLDQEIPGLMEELKKLRNDLAQNLEKLETLSSGKGSECAFIHRIVAMYDDFIEDPDEIAERLETYSTYSSSLAQYVVTGMTQPLELDYIVVSSRDYVQNESKSGFLKKLSFRFMRFMYSFVADYSSIGNVYNGSASDSTPLDVWVSVNDINVNGVAVGRDQSQVLKALIDRNYSVEYEQMVNLSLVSSTEALMQAVMAGTGPDVALFTPKALAGNLALREALVNLNDLDGIDNIKDRFYPSALKAYALEEKLFALPETQSFNMLFYRKDILDELNIKAPKTWNEFYDALYTIQKQNLLVGVINSTLVYESFILQNGGSLYNSDMSKMALTEPEGIEAFEIWCRLYTLYEVPYSFDAFSRFRTGEMPLLINSSTFANQLWASAPELDGLWGMMPIPGTSTEDGINRTETCNSTGAVIIKGTLKLDKAYEFINWWTSDEAQTSYAQDVESTLGLSARHLSANRNAFKTMEWETEYKNALMEQWKEIDDFYISPASYFVSRNLTNAFRKVIMNNTNPRDTLNTYSRGMQEELDRKRKEFGLS